MTNKGPKYTIRPSGEWTDLTAEELSKKVQEFVKIGLVYFDIVRQKH